MEDLFEVKSFFNKKVADVKRIALDDAEKKKKKIISQSKINVSENINCTRSPTSSFEDVEDINQSLPNKKLKSCNVPCEKQKKHIRKGP